MAPNDHHALGATDAESGRIDRRWHPIMPKPANGDDSVCFTKQRMQERSIDVVRDVLLRRRAFVELIARDEAKSPIWLWKISIAFSNEFAMQGEAAGGIAAT